jgi:hypothetical protein
LVHGAGMTSLSWAIVGVWYLYHVLLLDYENLTQLQVKLMSFLLFVDSLYLTEVYC